MRRLDLVIRDLHLHFGLFLSPFILAFSVSVFYLVHGLAQQPAPDASDDSRTVTNLSVPADIDRLQGRAMVDALRPLLEQLGVHGEVDFVRHVATEHRLIVPVRLPDRDTIVSLDYEQRTATVTSRRNRSATPSCTSTRCPDRTTSMSGETRGPSARGASSRTRPLIFCCSSLSAASTCGLRSRLSVASGCF